jgi:hypothetical protein
LGRVLCEPENGCREHKADILGDVCVAVVEESFGITSNDVLENKDALA